MKLVVIWTLLALYCFVKFIKLVVICKLLPLDLHFLKLPSRLLHSLNECALDSVRDVSGNLSSYSFSPI
uniref:Uncharacterized protein n=1 Tax=Panstrongylus lignarius TaxID=156445 RepID=A0A224XUP4_9HEMI